MALKFIRIYPIYLTSKANELKSSGLRRNGNDISSAQWDKVIGFSINQTEMCDPTGGENKTTSLMEGTF